MGQYISWRFPQAAGNDKRDVLVIKGEGDCNCDDSYQKKDSNGNWENVSGDGRGHWRDLDREKKNINGVETCIIKRWLRDFNTNDREDWALYCMD